MISTPGMCGCARRVSSPPWRRSSWRLLFAVVLVMTTLSSTGDESLVPPAAAIERMQWLAGCWERRTRDHLVEEQWMAPRGGLMLGMSRTVKGEQTVEYEQTLIRRDGGRLVFTARPSGQSETSFIATELGSAKVVFENAGHDFPQRVIYELTATGSLAARIEGTQDGKLLRIDFPYSRVACAGSSD